MKDYPLFIFDASRHRDLIPETVEDVTVVRKALAQLCTQEDGGNALFFLLGEYLGKKQALEILPVFDPQKGETQTFAWRENPEHALWKWKGAVWMPKCWHEKYQASFISILLRLSRFVGLDVYDGKFGIYIPAKGLPLPQKEGERYREAFDPDGMRREPESAIIWAIEPRFDLVWDFDDNGLAVVQVNGKCGYINEKGEEVIPPRFDRADDFAANGLASVKINGKWGFIDRKGEEVIPPRFDLVESFTANGLAAVEIDDDECRYTRKWGYINERGEEVIPLRFDNAYPFDTNGLALVKSGAELPSWMDSLAANGHWGYINEKGEEIIPARFDEASYFAANGLAVVKINDKWGYINEKGEEVIPLRFEDAELFNANGLARVRIKGKWGYINEKGKSMISPHFDEAGVFVNGLAPVKVKGRWGYINEKGKKIIRPHFDDAWNFAANGLAAVEVDDKIGYINTKGEFVIPPRFDISHLRSVSNFQFMSDFHFVDGLAGVLVGDKCGYINAKGEFVIPPCFNMVYTPTANGLARVEVYGGGKFGFIRIPANRSPEPVENDRLPERNSESPRSIFQPLRNLFRKSARL
ncbi:MAG: WG repeat-containing protein [Zoogloeaceae bacterium]|nr:WG repeat-containing protein [Zoogloeaceae bacterium]